MNTVRFDKNKFHLHQEMMQWCRDNIGPGSWVSMYVENGKWAIDIIFGNTTFVFKDPEDMLMFKMIWG